MVHLAGFNINDIYTGIITAIVTTPGIVAAVKKYAANHQGQIQAVEKEVQRGHAFIKDVESKVEKALPVIETVGKDAVKAAEDVLDLPALTSVKGALEVRLHHAESTLADWQIGSVVKDALLAHNKGWSALTADEQATLVQIASHDLAKLGVNVTPGQIVGVAKKAQDAAQAIRQSAVFQQTQQLVATKAALQAEADAATAPAQTTSQTPQQPAPAATPAPAQ